jgi:hypothetical protein
LPQAFVVVGDYNGHVGLGVKCAKEVRGFAGAERLRPPWDRQLLQQQQQQAKEQPSTRHSQLAP